MPLASASPHSVATQPVGFGYCWRGPLTTVRRPRRSERSGSRTRQRCKRQIAAGYRRGCAAPEFTLSNESIMPSLVVDLAPTVRLEPAPDQRVMRPHEFKRRAVTETRRHLRSNSTMPVNMTARNLSVPRREPLRQGLPADRRCGRSRNASTAARSTWMMALGISPRASRWTRSAVAGSGACT